MGTYHLMATSAQQHPRHGGVTVTNHDSERLYVSTSGCCYRQYIYMLNPEKPSSRAAELPRNEKSLGTATPHL